MASIMNKNVLLSVVVSFLMSSATGCRRRRSRALKHNKRIRAIGLTTIHGDCGRRGLSVVEGFFSSTPSPSKMKACGDVQYNLFMHTDDHVGLVAIPANKEEDNVCPSVYLHDSMIDGKVMEEVEEVEEGSETLMFLSVFPLKAIVEAFVVTDAHNHQEEESGEYDILANNCASFAMGMAIQLGMDINQEMAEHAIKNLSVNGSALAVLMDHPDFEKIFPGGAAMAEEHPDALMKIFVEHYIKTHIDPGNLSF